MRVEREERVVVLAEREGRAAASERDERAVTDGRDALVERDERDAPPTGRDVPADRAERFAVPERSSFERRLSLRPATYLACSLSAEASSPPMAVTSPAPIVMTRSPSLASCMRCGTTSILRGT